jgi:hypothetical protein
MKTIKTLIFAGLCTIALNCIAQKTATSIAQQRTDYIRQHVSNLTTAQKAKILKIEKQCSSALKTADGPVAKDSVSASSESQIKTVLNYDQYMQYKKIRKQLPKETTSSK